MLTNAPSATKLSTRSTLKRQRNAWTNGPSVASLPSQRHRDDVCHFVAKAAIQKSEHATAHLGTHASKYIFTFTMTISSSVATLASTTQPIYTRFHNHSLAARQQHRRKFFLFLFFFSLETALTLNSLQLQTLFKLLRFYGTLSKEVRVSSGAPRAWLTKQHYIPRSGENWQSGDSIPVRGLGHPPRDSSEGCPGHL